MANIEFGKRLETLIKLNRHTQTQVAKNLGIPKSSLNNMLAGVMTTIIVTLEKLAEHFDVSLDYLLLGRNGEYQALQTPPGLTHCDELIDGFVYLKIARLRER